MPNEESRPAANGAASSRLAGADSQSVTPADRSDANKTTMPRGVAETEPRRGKLVRVTTARTVLCRCRDCGREFPSTGCAASHARAARHRVSCDYHTVFEFVPLDMNGAAEGDTGVPSAVDPRPVAWCRIVPPTRRGQPYLAVVDDCPLCGKTHTHGAGTDPALPHLGGRVPHCMPPRRGDTYQLAVQQ